MNANEIERMLEERIARERAAQGEHDARVAVRLARETGDSQTLQWELRALLRPSVPVDYARAFAEAVFNAVLNNREDY